MRPSPANQLHIARISAVEVIAAISRRVRSGSLSKEAGQDAATQFRADFAKLQDVVEISAELIARATNLAEKYALRAYDAVQLAAALAVHEAATTLGLATTIVSADEELNAAAIAEGLQIENPNLHP
ncbi:MAG TPA: type II toxin-antitoxin system VapC family toxin [Tepidisphaeraceae bacterium]|jgi:hypothetical protein|nr:type II toxin-antitoxin system VapC family toxin [Tepidisphaeraceae bacterium]